MMQAYFGRGASKIQHWQHDRQDVLHRLKSVRRAAKIVLKTRNETSLLRRWITHHLEIFGPDGIVIFDNESTNQETFAIYHEFSDRIQVVQFSGMHNLLHDTRVFPSLYEALRESCAYFIFLDTDEFLFWHGDEHRIASDQTLIDLILADGSPIIPGLWIENAPGRDDELLYTFRSGRLISGLRGGKPFISSMARVEGFINHNIQIDRDVLRSCRTGNLLILHMKNLSAEQRISVNLQKLQSYNATTRELEGFGLTGRDFSIEDLLGLDVEALKPGNTRNYVIEIRRLVEKGLETAASDAGARISDGRLIFANPVDDAEIGAFLKNPLPVFRKAFNLEG